MIAPDTPIFARSRSPWRKAPFQTFLYKLYLRTHCLCGFFGNLKSIFDLFIFFLSSPLKSSLSGRPFWFEDK